MLRKAELLLILALFCGQPAALHAQNPRPFVQQAVNTELAASSEDHSHWLFFEIASEPGKNVKRWVAQAHPATVERVVERNGQALTEAQQRQEMEAFMRDARAQSKQHRSGEHDDEEAAELLRILPDAFIWTVQGDKGADIFLHFKPNAQFDPPNLEARVFAAMEGDMTINKEQHRIVSLKGRLTRDVKILGGFIGYLQAGGTFDVERREIGEKLWQITETHVHIQGHAIFFHTISDQEDEVKSKFEELPANISFEDAEQRLMTMP